MCMHIAHLLSKMGSGTCPYSEINLNFRGESKKGQRYLTSHKVKIHSHTCMELLDSSNYNMQK